MSSKKSLIIFAKLLRKEQTKPEKLLWVRLRNRNLNGYKFRRQHPIGNSYIVDFYCSSKRLIVEVDGKIHEQQEVKEKDKVRECFLLKWNYKILRIKNEEVYSDIEKVLMKIIEALE